VHRTVISVLSTVAVTAATLTAVATPSSAAPVTVGLKGFVDMAVDEAHGNVLVTQGSASSDIVVLDLDGTAKTPVTGMPDARDVHLSSDGSVFYVTLPTQKAIGVIDAADTTNVTTIPLGADVCPTSVAQEGEVLWFSYTDCAYGSGELGSVQLSDSSVTLGLTPAGVHPDRVESSPGLADHVVVRDYSTLTVLDVSSGPTATATAGPSASSDARDFAVSPDGVEVISTEYAPYRQVGYSTSTMLPRTVYGTDAYPNAVAVRDDGLVAAGIDGSYSDDVFLFHEGSSALYRSYELGAYVRLADRGLAFGATDLYVVSNTYYPGSTWTFQRITPRLSSSMTLTRGSTVYRYGASAKVTVNLSVPHGVVKVYTTPYGGTKKLLTTAAVDGTGRLVVTTPVKVRTTFSVYYAGDADHDPVSRATTVAVRASVTQSATRVVGTSGSYKLVRSGSAPRVYGTVRPYHVGQCVRFQIQQPSSTGWRYTQTSGCIRLNSYSKTYVYFDRSWTPGDRVRVRTMWGGDTKNAAANSTWLYLRFVS
jgi:hypothetical protein